MDVFAGTFLSAAAASGVARSFAARHLPVVRRCVRADEDALLVARCGRPGGGPRGGRLLLITRRRLVVTQESGLLRRLRLHLHAELHQLAGVGWSVDPGRSAVDLAVTAVDGVRERFRIQALRPELVDRLGDLLDEAFRLRAPGARCGGAVPGGGASGGVPPRGAGWPARGPVAVRVAGRRVLPA
ncbi:MAG TPA: hypothetical protein VNV66_10715 [Pilimelia sp.]|nr:hypothetical protein [Pilimelia sp.]